MKITIETEEERQGQRLVMADDIMLAVSMISDKMREALNKSDLSTFEELQSDLDKIVWDYWRD